MSSTPVLRDGPDDARTALIFAHGAGAGMDHSWMQAMAERLADRGVAVIRFEFPYMQRRRAEGSRKPPDRMPKLQQAYRDVVAEQAGFDQLLIGGKSMGGRVASMVADELKVSGLVCMGYPFHPPKKPENLRTAHLEGLTTPTLILQGERDPFGVPDEVAGYALSGAIQVKWLPDGDHGLKPRKASGTTLEKNLDRAADAVVEFASGLS